MRYCDRAKRAPSRGFNKNYASDKLYYMAKKRAKLAKAGRKAARKHK